MPVTKLPFLTIFLFCKKRPFRIFDQFRGLFQETNGKIWEVCVEKEKKRKTQITKVGKSCHQVTWTQKKHDQKERARVNF